MTLWEVRKLLGREKGDRVILESHFQLDDFTTPGWLWLATLPDVEADPDGGVDRFEALI